MNMRNVAVVLTVGLLLAGAAQAAITTVPTGLNPGDQYRIVFVTSGETYARAFEQGTSTPTGGPTDSAGYNAFATSAATAVTELNALGTTWTAIVSVELASGTLVSAKSNTGTDSGVGVAFYNLDGEIVANNNADLWDGTIANAIDVTELGTAPVDQSSNDSGQYLVWTGTQSGGTGHSDNSLVTPSGGWIRYGVADSTDDTWVDKLGDVSGWGANDSTNSTMPIYVMSGVLTVPVHEPATMSLLALGGIALIRRRRRA